MNEIEQIKKLAGKSIREKWEKMDCNIFHNCSFCIDAMSRKPNENVNCCSICYLPTILCSHLSHTNLFEIITDKYHILSEVIVEDISHSDSYKLMVKCMYDLRTTGKISDGNLKAVKDMIENFESEK